MVKYICNLRFLEENLNNKKEDSNEFVGFFKKFKGTLVKITDKNSKIVLFNSNGEEFPKSNVFYDKSLNANENKGKGIKYCNPLLSDGKLNFRFNIQKHTLIFQVLSKNSWKFCFATEFNSEKNVNFIMSSRMFKESFFYEITNLKLSTIDEIKSLSLSVNNNSTISTIKQINHASEAILNEK
jgi:hypothetical protein